MHSNLPRTSAALALLLASSVLASAQTVQRIDDPPPLSPAPIRTGGRVAVVSTGQPDAPQQYVSQWPGTRFATAFRGSTIFFRIGPNRERLHLLIDGKPTPDLVHPEPGVYRLSGLSDRPHRVDLLVASESQDAPNTFGGFALPAGSAPAPLPPPRIRQIEFIGDSHTVGYGNTSAKQDCTTDEVWSTTDDTEAFGPRLARAYDADYQVNAISGRGVVRNYDGFAAPLLPDAYPYTLFDRKQLYQDPNWKPQVIVVALGTNDFSTALHSGEVWTSRADLHAAYEARYATFLQQLRAKNLSALIVLWSTDLANGEIEAEERAVVTAANARGDRQIVFVPVHGLALTGCHGHPSLADDAAIAEALRQVIDRERPAWKHR